MIIFNNNSIGYVLDVDASKVIEAVRSTGVTITPAMMHYAHYLISNMKNIGTWQLSNAVYGFVGGTADSHKWNWKDLRDVDAAFRLTFGGVITHSSFGIKSDGAVASFAQTYITPSTSLILNNTHLSFYASDNDITSTSEEHIGTAQVGDAARSFSVIVRRSNNVSASIAYGGANGVLIGSQTTAKGFTIGNRPSSTVHQLIKNGVIIASSTLTSGTFPSASIAILNVNNNIGVNQASTRLRCSFSSIGQGFTAIQAQQQSQIVTNAQNILNRA